MERRVKRNCTYGGKLLLKGDTVYISEPFNFGKQKVFDKDRNLIFFDEIDSNDFEFVATEDKKAPVDAETFLQSKDIWHHPMVMDRNHKNGFEIADLLQEFGSQERNMAIQQAIEIINDKLPFEFKTRFSPDYHEINIALEKLKKDS